MAPPSPDKRLDVIYTMASIDTNDEIIDGMLGDFLDEADGLLVQLNDQLLQLDQWVKTHDGTSQDRPASLLNDMFRAAHSIKGLSGMMRLNDINVLTHRIENVFDAARNLLLPLTVEVVEILFAGVDCLSAMTEGLKGEGTVPQTHSPLLHRIDSVLDRYNAKKQSGCQVNIEAQLDEITTQFHEEQAIHEAATIDSTATRTVDDADIPPKYLAMFLDEGGQRWKKSPMHCYRHST
jgi:two-component system chemotaxis sensor kinase CheA